MKEGTGDDSEKSVSEGELASMAFNMFQRGASPVQVVMVLETAPNLALKLYNDWLVLSGCLRLSRQSWALINGKTSYRIKGQADLDAVIGSLVSDHQKLKGFRYLCSRCGRPLQAAWDNEWKWLIENRALSSWSHETCPGMS